MTTTTEDQIREIQLQIERLKERSVLELRVKLAEAKGQVIALEKEIDKITGAKPDAPEAAAAGAARKPRVSVTIEQVVNAIKGGATNYRAVASKLGCSSQTVANKIKEEGKKAGIKSTGERAFFKLGLK